MFWEVLGNVIDNVGQSMTYMVGGGQRETEDRFARRFFALSAWKLKKRKFRSELQKQELNIGENQQNSFWAEEFALKNQVY